MQGIAGGSHRIENHDERFWLTGSCQRPDSRKSSFAARAALTIAKYVSLYLAIDGVAVPQRLARLDHNYRAVGSARDNFSGVHLAEAQNLHAPADRASRSHHIRSRQRLLRAQRTGA